MELKLINRTLFAPGHTRAEELFVPEEYPWQILDKIETWILQTGPTLSKEEFSHPAPGQWIARDASIAPAAVIEGPCIIDRGAQLRPGAYLRGKVLVGRNCVVGNSTEVKNALLFDQVQVPHFNYVGDSILGYRSHLGAGAVTSNVKSDRSQVTVSLGSTKLNLGRIKAGAFLGDGTEVGCNSVLCPGTILGQNTTVYPLSCVRGYIPENSIYKDAEHIVIKE